MHLHAVPKLNPSLRDKRIFFNSFFMEQVQVCCSKVRGMPFTHTLRCSFPPKHRLSTLASPALLWNTGTLVTTSPSFTPSTCFSVWRSRSVTVFLLACPAKTLALTRSCTPRASQTFVAYPMETPNVKSRVGDGELRKDHTCGACKRRLCLTLWTMRMNGYRHELRRPTRNAFFLRQKKHLLSQRLPPPQRPAEQKSCRGHLQVLGGTKTHPLLSSDFEVVCIPMPLQTTANVCRRRASRWENSAEPREASTGWSSGAATKLNGTQCSNLALLIPASTPRWANDIISSWPSGLEHGFVRFPCFL